MAIFFLFKEVSIWHFLFYITRIYGGKFLPHVWHLPLFLVSLGEDECKISFGQLRRFSWREIQLATDNFCESNIIGQGGFGKVYKGVLLDKTKVAVKRLIDYHSPGGEAAFLREVQLISVAVHKNLLRLIGFCTTSSERILVYPFMQNLSVAYRLRGNLHSLSFFIFHGCKNFSLPCRPQCDISLKR